MISYRKISKIYGFVKLQTFTVPNIYLNIRRDYIRNCHWSKSNLLLYLINVGRVTLEAIYVVEYNKHEYDYK